MRIAVIGPFGLVPKGTMRVRALALARELVRRGHTVIVIMPPWHTPAEAGRRWQEDGVTLEYVPLRAAFPLLAPVLTTWRLWRRALAWQPDVIHCFKPKAYAGLVGWMAWHAQRLGLLRARLVIDEDDWEGSGGWNDLEPYPAPLRAFFAWQERWGLRHSDAVTVASRTLQTLAWSLGVPPVRVWYLPNGAIPRLAGNGAAVRRRMALGDAPVVLLYTRFFEFDVARAVDVFARVVAAIPSARLLVVGTALHPADDERFDRLVAERRLQAQVVRAGWVSEAQLGDYLAAADVAIYPFDDTLVNRAKCAVKLSDLLAAGVPVVADAVGQNREYVVHNETGLVVPPGDVQAMTEAALRLLCDGAEGRRLATAAQHRMRTQFSWSVLVETLERAYRSRKP